MKQNKQILKTLIYSELKDNGQIILIGKGKAKDFQSEKTLIKNKICPKCKDTLKEIIPFGCCYELHCMNQTCNFQA